MAPLHRSACGARCCGGVTPAQFRLRGGGSPAIELLPIEPCWSGCPTIDQLRWRGCLAKYSTYVGASAPYILKKYMYPTRRAYKKIRNPAGCKMHNRGGHGGGAAAQRMLPLGSCGIDRCWHARYALTHLAACVDAYMHARCSAYSSYELHRTDKSYLGCMHKLCLPAAAHLLPMRPRCCVTPRAPL